MLGLVAGIGKTLLSGSGKSEEKKGGGALAKSMFDRKKKENEKEDEGNIEKKPLTVIKREKVSYPKLFTDIKEVDVQVDENPVSKSVDNLQKAVAGLLSAAQDSVDVKKKGERDKQKVDKKKEKKKMGLGILEPIKRVAFDFLDMIKRFFLFTIIGGIITAITKNIGIIVEAIRKTIEKVQEVFEFMNEYLFKPIGKVFEFIAGPIVELIAKIMGVPPIDAEKNTIMQNILEITKQIPLLGDVVTDLENLMNEHGKSVPLSGRAGGQSYQYNSSQAGGLVASGGIKMGSKAKQQASKAGFGESEFTLYRDTVAQIESGGKYDIQGGSGNMYSGRYQMGADARKDAARFLGETYQGDTEEARKKFRSDPEMQERYFAAYTRANHETLMTLSQEYRNLSKEGKLQVLGYAHNAGAGRALDWMEAGRSESFRDGFDTRSDKYSESIRKAQELSRTGQLDSTSLGAMTGDASKLGALSGHSGSVAYNGQQRASLSTAYSPFSKDDIRSQGMSIISGKGYRASTNSVHKGFDVPAVNGTPVYAYLPGKVTQNRVAPGYGKIIEWEDSVYGEKHMYAHLSEASLPVGTRFVAGALLGKTGDTGTPGSYHLHWEIGGAGGEKDPAAWVRSHPLPSPAQIRSQGGSPAQEVSQSASYDDNNTVAFVQTPQQSGGSGGVNSSGGSTPSSSTPTYAETAKQWTAAKIASHMYKA